MQHFEYLGVPKRFVAFLPDEDSLCLGESIRRYPAFGYGDVGLVRGAPDDKVVEHAREHGAIVLTRNIRDFMRVMRDAAERSSAGDCQAMHCHEGCGLVTVHQSVTSFNFERVTRNLEYNGHRVYWDDVFILNLRVHIRHNRSVKVSVLPRCQKCDERHLEGCERCAELSVSPYIVLGGEVS